MLVRVGEVVSCFAVAVVVMMMLTGSADEILGRDARVESRRGGAAHECQKIYK